MIKILLLSFLLLTAGCSQLNKTDTHRRPGRSDDRLTKSTQDQSSRPNVLGTDKTGNIQVDSNWMKEYLRMEHGVKIPADSGIWRDGDTYWVPPDVSAHYSQMKIAASTPPKPGT